MAYSEINAHGQRQTNEKSIKAKQIKVRFFIHCTNFSGHYNLLKIKKNFINLVSLERLDPVKYYNEKNFRKKIEKNGDKNF